MSRRKAILIANPKAGGGLIARDQAISVFKKTLTAHAFDVEVAFTTEPASAADIATSAIRDGATDIIIHGGDGTVNEVLQGIVGHPVRVAIWPGGTANVLAKELGMPAPPDQCADIISEGCTRLIYIARAFSESTGQSRYFLLMAIGLDASVVYSVQPGLKRLFGKAAFWYSGVGQFFKWRPQPFEVEIGSRVYPATFAAIGNCQRYGGNLAITPRARLDEPDFEICLVNSTSRFRYLKFLFSALGEGLNSDEEDVKFIRTARARATGNVSVQLDGELVGKLPITFEIADWRLELIVPKMTLVTPHLAPASQSLRSVRPALGESLAGSSM
jgi:diacylglycerol kinase (ATP)